MKKILLLIIPLLFSCSSSEIINKLDKIDALCDCEDENLLIVENLHKLWQKSDKQTGWIQRLENDEFKEYAILAGYLKSIIEYCIYQFGEEELGGHYEKCNSKAKAKRLMKDMFPENYKIIKETGKIKERYSPAFDDTYCSDPEACNYNEDVEPEYINNEKCEYKLNDCDTCSGETDGSGTVVDNDSDGDGVCDSWDSDNSGNL